MKTEEQVQRAHDLLLPVVMGDVPHELDDDVVRALHAAVDALCWVLGHDHNDAFQMNLSALEDHLKSQGYRLRKL